MTTVVVDGTRVPYAVWRAAMQVPHDAPAGTGAELMLDHERHADFCAHFMQTTSDNTSQSIVNYVQAMYAAQEPLACTHPSARVEILSQKYKQKEGGGGGGQKRRTSKRMRDPLVCGVAMVRATECTLAQCKSLDEVPSGIVHALCSSPDLRTQQMMASHLTYQYEWLNACVCLSELRRVEQSALTRISQLAQQQVRRRQHMPLDVGVREHVRAVDDRELHIDHQYGDIHPYRVSFSVYACVHDYIRQSRLLPVDMHAHTNLCKACDAAGMCNDLSMDDACMALYMRVRALLDGQQDVRVQVQMGRVKCLFCQFVHRMCLCVLKWTAKRMGEQRFTQAPKITALLHRTDAITLEVNDLRSSTQIRHQNEYCVPLECMLDQAMYEFRAVHVLMQAFHARKCDDTSAGSRVTQDTHVREYLAAKPRGTTVVAHRHLVPAAAPSALELRVQSRAPHFVALEHADRIDTHARDMRDVAHTAHVYNQTHRKMAQKRKRDSVPDHQDLVHVRTSFERDRQTARVGMQIPTPMHRHLQHSSAARYGGVSHCFSDAQLDAMPGSVLFLNALMRGNAHELRAAYERLYSMAFVASGRSRSGACVGLMAEDDPCFSLMRLLPVLLCVGDGPEVLEILWEGIQAPYTNVRGLVPYSEHALSYQALTQRSSLVERRECTHDEEQEQQAIAQPMEVDDVLNAQDACVLQNAREQLETDDDDLAERLGINDCIRRRKLAGIYDPAKDGEIDYEAERLRPSFLGHEHAETIRNEMEELTIAGAREPEVERTAEQDQQRMVDTLARLQQRREQEPEHDSDPDQYNCSSDSDQDGTASRSSSMFMSEAASEVIQGEVAADGAFVNAQKQTHGSTTTTARKRPHRRHPSRLVYNWECAPFYASLLAFLAPRKTRVQVRYDLLRDVWDTLLSNAELWRDHRHLVTFMMELMVQPRDTRDLLRRRNRRLPMWMVWRQMRSRYIVWCQEQHVESERTSRFNYAQVIEDCMDSDDEQDQDAPLRRTRTIRRQRVLARPCSCARCAWVSCDAPLPAHVHDSPADFLFAGDAQSVSTSAMFEYIDRHYGRPSEYAERHAQMAVDQRTCVHKKTGIYDPLCPVPPRPPPSAMQEWLDVDFRIQFQYSVHGDRRYSDDDSMVLPTHSYLLPNLRTPVHMLLYVLAADPRCPRAVASRVFPGVQCAMSRTSFAPPPTPFDLHQSLRYRQAHQRVGEWCAAQLSEVRDDADEPPARGAAQMQRLEWIRQGCPALSDAQIRAGLVMPFAPMAMVVTALESMTHLAFARHGTRTDTNHPRVQQFAGTHTMLGPMCLRQTVGLEAVCALFDPRALRMAIAHNRLVPVAQHQDTQEMYHAEQLLSLYDAPFSKCNQASRGMRRLLRDGEFQSYVGPLTHVNDRLLDACLAFPVRRLDVDALLNGSLVQTPGMDGGQVYTYEQRQAHLRELVDDDEHACLQGLLASSGGSRKVVRLDVSADENMHAQSE